MVASLAPAITATCNPKTHLRQITFVAAINPLHQTCPDGGVPYADIPCSFRGLGVSARIYVPGRKAAALMAGAVAAPTTPCDFTCTVTASWGADLRGPATVILKFSIGDLIIAANDLSGSSYETTAQLPAIPTVGLLHPLKPKVAFSGKLSSMTLNVAATIQGGDQVCCNVGALEVVPSTKITFDKVLPGNLTVCADGWYGKTGEASGSLLHRTLGPKNMKLAKVIVYGYLEPAHPVDEGSPVAVSQVSQPEEFSQLFGLPETDSIY